MWIYSCVIILNRVNLESTCMDSNQALLQSLVVAFRQYVQQVFYNTKCSLLKTYVSGLVPEKNVCGIDWPLTAS
jgi:hypothetical protein